MEGALSFGRERLEADPASADVEAGEACVGVGADGN
jgi:hypothetical protein